MEHYFLCIYFLAFFIKYGAVPVSHYLIDMAVLHCHTNQINSKNSLKSLRPFGETLLLFYVQDAFNVLANVTKNACSTCKGKPSLPKAWFFF